MSVLPIVIGEGNPVLHAKTKNVKTITKDILALISDMQETVKAAKGAGLAAPQVGRSERLCLALLGKKMMPLINPKIMMMSKEQSIAEEGCLSLPEIWIQVARSEEIVVSFLTPEGKARELKLVGWDARVAQHEIDHLDGVLITDRRKEMVL
jgi:peptide deformylase